MLHQPLPVLLLHGALGGDLEGLVVLSQAAWVAADPHRHLVGAVRGAALHADHLELGVGEVLDLEEAVGSLVVLVGGQAVAEDGAFVALVQELAVQAVQLLAAGYLVSHEDVNRAVSLAGAVQELE